MPAKGASWHTLLWIPESGLFHRDGHFEDGFQNEINWANSIPVWRSYKALDKAKRAILERYPDRRGQLIALSFVPQEREGARRGLPALKFMEEEDGDRAE